MVGDRRSPSSVGTKINWCVSRSGERSIRGVCSEGLVTRVDDDDFVPENVFDKQCALSQTDCSQLKQFALGQPRILMPGISHDVQLAYPIRNTARLNPYFQALSNGASFVEPCWDSQGWRTRCVVIGQVPVP